MNNINKHEIESESIPSTKGIIRGMIFDIQKFSIHDGPGIRTLIFFKGCPLRCKWCANPEGQSKNKNLMYNESICKKCGKCAKVCQHGARSDTGLFLRRDLCQICGECVRQCPVEALKMIGQEMDVPAIMSIIMEDMVFYSQSGGGVTLGGGEPTLWPELATALLRECKNNLLHTAIESCAYSDWYNWSIILPYLDLIFVDIKVMNEKRHLEVTGSSNQLILENVKRLLNPKYNEHHVPIIIRIPVIPSINDDEKNFVDTAEFIVTNNQWNLLQEVELLPYHQYGVKKYQGLGLTYPLSDCSPNDSDQNLLTPQKLEQLSLPPLYKKQDWMIDVFKRRNIVCTLAKSF